MSFGAPPLLIDAYMSTEMVQSFLRRPAEHEQDRVRCLPWARVLKPVSTARVGEPDSFGHF